MAKDYHTLTWHLHRSLVMAILIALFRNNLTYLLYLLAYPHHYDT